MYHPGNQFQLLKALSLYGVHIQTGILLAHTGTILRARTCTESYSAMSKVSVSFIVQTRTFLRVNQVDW